MIWVGRIRWRTTLGHMAIQCSILGRESVKEQNHWRSGRGAGAHRGPLSVMDNQRLGRREGLPE